MTLTYADYGILVLFGLIVGLIAHARGIAKDLDAWTKYLDAELPQKTERKILRRLDELELRQDKIGDGYNRLRGTVARLHRSDVRGSSEEAAGPAPNDESSRIAYKEKLRDSARQRGLLK